MVSKDYFMEFSVDRGGTFTDIYCEVFESKDELIPVGYYVEKLLSEDANYKSAALEGIRRLQQRILEREFAQEKPLDGSKIRQIRMGTTVGTNALLERTGGKTGIFITRGFRDILNIGNQSRPRIFDLTMYKPKPLSDIVFEVNERVRLVNDQTTNDTIHHHYQSNKDIRRVKIEQTGDIIEIIEELDECSVKQQLEEAYNVYGIKSISIVLLHSYIYPEHENRVAQIAQSLNIFENISVSNKIIQMIKLVPRGQTTLVDAYLNPIITQYVQQFIDGFNQETIQNTKIFFMQSDGGLTPYHQFRGSKSILSGPAGGVIGYSETTNMNQQQQNIIGIDMGGTSTDVSRLVSGTLEHVYDEEIGGVTIQTPHLDISTVAAGGGSRLFFENSVFRVGPESARADPGPVCYGRGGFLAITDANLILGRVIPKYFPNIFGKTDDQPLFVELTKQAFNTLRLQIIQEIGKDMTIEQVAYGYIKVANENMCRPIRNITVGRGQDPRTHALSVFGGAGAQHACAIARNLGITTILIHKHAGILSAYGLALAQVVEDTTRPIQQKYEEIGQIQLQQFHDQIKQENTQKLLEYGFTVENIRHEEYLNMRYYGTDTQLMVSKKGEQNDYMKEFISQHQQLYGFNLYGKSVMVDNVRVRSYGIKQKYQVQVGVKEKRKVIAVSMQYVYYEVNQELKGVMVPVYILEDIVECGGLEAEEPMVILSNGCTIIVEPQWRVIVDQEGTTILQYIYTDIHIHTDIHRDIHSEIIECDPIELSIFGNRFMSIAEQMGRTLQRTAVSTNIKERLDFSCAIFSQEGKLVANAPHLPVHLGSMSEAVTWQINNIGQDWVEGEIILANHPMAGGSHLPDMTIISPVYDEQGIISFYVASRGHHADIGGITPGSMPAFSKTIRDEGIAIKSFKIVKDNTFQEQDLIDLLMNPGEGIQGSRNIQDNISDLKAQIASNNRGIILLKELIREQGKNRVYTYMRYIQQNAEQSVRSMLVQLSYRNGFEDIHTIHEQDYMDDGSEIHLGLTLNRISRTAQFDFSGSSYQVYGNINTPKSVVMSAIIYCLRCLVDKEIPLNQGCLVPINVIIPEQCILNPSEDAAIVGGNVLTSQRLTDIILKAFRYCADSQGCMNNLTFGNQYFSYYETIAGGGGAGPTWNGQSGVQCHMTNTRITDPEILEKRYPVLLRTFSLRPNSGGLGNKNGGNGIIREIEFLQQTQISVLTERRVHAPNGLFGGCPGSKGLNLWKRYQKNIVNLGAKNSVEMQPYDRIVIYTPGGGGYGSPNHTQSNHQQEDKDTQKQNITSEYLHGSAQKYKIIQESS